MFAEQRATKPRCDSSAPTIWQPVSHHHQFWFLAFLVTDVAAVQGKSLANTTKTLHRLREAQHVPSRGRGCDGAPVLLPPFGTGTPELT